LPFKIKLAQITLLTETNINPRTIPNANSLSVNVNCKKFAEVSQFSATFINYQILTVVTVSTLALLVRV